MSTTGQPHRLLRKPQVFGRNGIIPVNPTTGWHWVRKGTFPAPVVLNPGERRSVVAWREADILKWLAERPQGAGHALVPSAYANRGNAHRRVSVAEPVTEEVKPRRVLPRR